MLNSSGSFCFLSWDHNIKRVAVTYLEQLPWTYQARTVVMDPETVLGARAKVEAKNISASGNGNRVGAVGV